MNEVSYTELVHNLLHEMRNFFIHILLIISLFLIFVSPERVSAAVSPFFGTVSTSPARTTQQVQDGITVAQYSLYWDRFEPTENQFSPTYINQVKSDLAQMRTNGARVILDFGVQYTPSWVFAYPNSRYVNQYGAAYSPSEPGKNIPNMVFNQVMRDKQQRYISKVFQELGTDFFGVRVGGGWYGELNYPDASYAGKTNLYWAYDANAQGTANNRPTGIPVSPVGSWQPGASSQNHQSAQQFVDWYLDSLLNYQNWQISTVRSAQYAGNIYVMYPSWGIRPGQLEEAVNNDLSGSTSVEINGEVQRGFDFDRFVRGLPDSKVVVYTTWLNAETSGDAMSDQTRWSPVHYLSYLAALHTPPLQVAGENTGHDSFAQMQLSISQTQKYGLVGMLWAFDEELHSGNPNYANYQQYVDLIPKQAHCREDIDQSGFVDLSDYSFLAVDFFRQEMNNPSSDISQDGKVDLHDYSLLVSKFFQKC